MTLETGALGLQEIRYQRWTLASVAAYMGSEQADALIECNLHIHPIRWEEAVQYERD
jgi:hypothetical protein